MSIGKYILPLLLSFLASFCHAQNDSLPKTDTALIKSTVFNSNSLNSKIGFTYNRSTYYNHKLYNPDIYQYRITFDPLFYNNWIYGTTFDRYQGSSYNKYNRHDPLNYLISTDPVNNWLDPTRLQNDYALGEAVIYILLQVLSSK